MDKETIINVVAEMNKLIDGTNMYSFWYQSNCFVDAILFDQVILWNSENDSRKWIIGEDGEEVKEPLINCIRKEFTRYVKVLNTIIIEPELIVIAISVLDNAGYGVDNLWSIDDVRNKDGAENFDDNTCIEILQNVLEDEFIVQQINEQIQTEVNNDKTNSN